MPSQRTLVDGETGQKFESIELIAGAALAVAGGPIVPAFYVDNAFPSSGADGSIAKPYQTAQAAFDACVLAGLTSFTLLIASLGAVPPDLTIPDGANVDCAVVGLSGYLGDAAVLAIPPQLVFGTVHAGNNSRLTLQNVTVGTALTATLLGASRVSAQGCWLRGNIVIGGASLYATTCTIDVQPPGLIVGAILQLAGCEARTTAGTVVTPLTQLRLDSMSERSLMNGNYTLDTGADLHPLDVRPTAIVGQDAAQANAFEARSRIVYPVGVLTAPRALTLQNGTGIAKSAVVDVYTQGFNVALVNQTGGLTFYTVLAGDRARIVCAYNTGTNLWSLLTRTLLP
jgi:hypothetical protein